MSTDEIRSYIQTLLGPEHTVLSANRVKLHSSHGIDPTPIHNVVKVKTCKPTIVANKLMGDRWKREDHVLFKTDPLYGESEK